MIISKKSIDFIILCEVTSQQHYEKKLSGIIVPAADSGATIGIGYDLGHQTPEQIERDWLFEIGSYQVAILKMFAGLKGDKAKRAVSSNMISKQVNIPFKSACNVFIKKSLPKYSRQALIIYPGLDKLLPDAAGAIVSMVYNRGAKLDGSRRTEMAAIIPLVAAADYVGIAQQIDKSKRLWVGVPNCQGVITRREKEAELVLQTEREYLPGDIVEI